MYQNNMKALIKNALAEDVGEGDVTAQLIPEHKKIKATLITRENMVLCGQDFFDEVFCQIDNTIKINWQYQDKDVLDANTQLCEVYGKARPILTAERTALNFLQTLSATATLTHQLVSLIRHTKTQLLDTRKTIPGLRTAQKYAVKCGGGINHRMGLYDAFLIKENHIHAAGSIANVVKKARVLNPTILLEIEVENLEQLQEALSMDVQRIMLDNFSISTLKQAVKLNHGRSKLEASGNVSELNIVEIAETGVDYISVGKLTKDIRAIDLSLRFQDAV